MLSRRTRLVVLTVMTVVGVIGLVRSLQSHDDQAGPAIFCGFVAWQWYLILTTPREVDK